MKINLLAVFLVLIGIGTVETTRAQHSVARLWNEELLGAIRRDYARPTVHARNLFHTAVVMYDGWAVYDEIAEPYFLGKTVDGFTCHFDGISPPTDIESARDETISYAAYRLLLHRFQDSPGAEQSLGRFTALMNQLGYDPMITSTDYSSGSPAALGNYIAEKMIEFGLQDGSNEQNNYDDDKYEPVNPPLAPALSGNPDMIDPNRWQPLSLDVFVDQSGNLLPGSIPKFLGPHWGEVSNFALSNSELKIKERDGNYYWYFKDPGPPPLLDTTQVGGLSEEFKWSFSLVSAWSSHLDPSDNVMWDISPASLGNIQQLPDTWAEYRDFYNLMEGGDPGMGYEENPYTGQPYEPQIVPRGDYTRVLAEFWADGPESETPPGHWFTILNYVSDHPLLEKRFKGTGPELNDLEWDVKAYFALGGAVHDVAVAVWGIKAWYDFVRPISAIRYMSDLGQSSDPSKPSFHPGGIPLVDGLIEIVEEGDLFADMDEDNIGKIKLYAWRGHSYINDRQTEAAGVGWILAEDWWPYQQPTFVTPPFAGYVSGHSSFSRAAAEVLTMLTGDKYFPGGLGEFQAKKNEFLAFEEGPSVDLTLQWATYRDASDQTSLSRIWGGIHPPIDDIRGRKIGIEIGVGAFEQAERYFNGQVGSMDEIILAKAYPNPIHSGDALTIEMMEPGSDVTLQLYNVLGQLVRSKRLGALINRTTFDTGSVASGFYILRIVSSEWQASQKVIILK